MIEKVVCPCCKSESKPLEIDVPNGFVVDFDMRYYTHKVFCENCRRTIKYSFKKKPN